MKRKHRLIFGAFVLTAVVMCSALLLPVHRPLTAAFLDVGDGLCVVIQSPSGKVLVVDCGTSGRRNTEAVGEKTAGRYIQSLGIDHIDAAVLSHPHSDHISGYASLLEVKPACLVMDAGGKCSTREYRRFIRAIKRCGATYKIARRGRSIMLDREIAVQILSPSKHKEYEQMNDNSVVLRIVYRRVGIMLASDAGTETEEDIIASGAKLRAQVLQVGHHGSYASTSPKWLSKVHPDIAIISCARDSQYGFPSPRTIDRLRSIGAQVYTTGTSGAVIIETDGSTIRVRTCRQSR